MRILHVYSGNTPLGVPPFVEDLGKQQISMGHNVEYFGVRGKGWRSYILETLRLRQYLKTHPCDVIHGHYIWSVLVGAVQLGRCIKIGSYIGSDLNIVASRRIARFAVTPLLHGVIVMNQVMARWVGKKKHLLVTPYGVDVSVFCPGSGSSGAAHPLIRASEINVLFSSRFDRPEKNVRLAREACIATGRKINLIEFKGLSRDDIVSLLNQVDMLLMTSVWEGSPQVVKEAMCCNCPVVTTNVGDVEWLLHGVDNSYVCASTPQQLANAMSKVVISGSRSNGRERILALKLSQTQVADRIVSFYGSVI